jgi:hypothetical protein
MQKNFVANHLLKVWKLSCVYNTKIIKNIGKRYCARDVLCL